MFLTCKIRFAGMLLATMLVMASCNGFLELGPPKNQLVTTSVFSDDGLADGAVAGMYHEMAFSQYPHFANGGDGSITCLMGLAADELRFNGMDAGRQAFADMQLSAASASVGTIWSSAYKTIFRANQVLEGLNTSGVSAQLAGRLRGEAFFVRAFAYFYLVNLYGDVPLVKTSDYKVSATLQRAAEKLVYESIEEDLNNAMHLLPADYSHAAAERVRPNRWAAAALLARVYLYQEKWQEAADLSGAVLRQDAYALLPVEGGIFLKNSKEAIWQLLAVTATEDTPEGLRAIPAPQSSTAPLYTLDDRLMAYFETGDARKQEWIGYHTLPVSGNGYLFPFKFKVRTTTATVPHREYSMVLRLAEQYLIRAEARMELGDYAGALEDINAIRVTHGKLEKLLTADRQGLLAAVEQERRLEFFYEWGHRWFDLKRWGKMDAVLSEVKPGWRPEAKWLPLPQKELDANPQLTQNKGY